jgi:uncharacterized membrane protein YfhO
MHLSLNDAMAQDYNGTSSYNSFNQKYYIQYLKAIGVITGTDEAATRWANGLTSRIIPEGINSVKYVLTKLPSDPMTLATFDSIGRFGDVTVLKHKYALPLGFAYYNIFSLDDFEKCSLTQRDFMSLRAAIVPGKSFNEISSIRKLSINDTLAPQSFSFDMIKNSIDTISQNVFRITDFKPTLINGSMSMPRPGIVYFSIPYDDNWTIKDETGKVYEKLVLSNGMTGINLAAGNHKLQLVFISKNTVLGKKISIAAFILFALLIFLSLKFKKTEN